MQSKLYSSFLITTTQWFAMNNIYNLKINKRIKARYNRVINLSVLNSVFVPNCYLIKDLEQ